MRKLAAVGRIFIAVAMIAFGIQHFVYLDFITRVFPKFPAWIPGHPALACLFGVFLLIAGVAILTGKETRTAALLLGGAILLSFALLHLPVLLANTANGGIWTNAGKGLALAGASFLVAGSVPAEFTSRAGFRLMVANALERFIPLSRFFLAFFLNLGGILHFIYVESGSSVLDVFCRSRADCGRDRHHSSMDDSIGGVANGNNDRSMGRASAHSKSVSQSE